MEQADEMTAQRHAIAAHPVAKEGDPFQIGLVLAGAISAGAYTAGVLDFLFEALDEWEKRRGHINVPAHQVVLKVIAGASAGGITGALGAIALARGLKPRCFTPQQIADCYPDSYPSHQEYQCVLPSLYSTWVERPAMVGSNGRGGLLDKRDLDTTPGTEGPILRSMLDASLLDAIKRAAIEPETDDETVKEPVPYIAKRLHLYLTLSNMRGIPFAVAFGRNSYGMQTVGDRVHYVVGDLGQTDVSVPSSWAERDAYRASIGLSVKTLPTMQGQPLPQDWDLYGTSALASGAFPLGLAPRQLKFAWDHYLHRTYPLPVPPSVQILPDFPPGTTDKGEFIFESVDGGLVNNNPFDYAQYALTGGQAKRADGKSVSQAIIMVAPFPDPPEFLPEGSPSPAIMAIVRALFPALVNQARFRASELAPAIDERDYSRYLIAPLRRIPGQKTKERFAIACGLLGGFGGFLDEKFRDHDFQLGRRNCQQFLRTSFHVEGDNAIIGAPGMTETLPVIPLVGKAHDPVPLPRWPKMSRADFNLLWQRTRDRADAIVPVLVNAQTPNLILRTALKSGWLVFLRRRVLGFVRLTILTDLVRRSQIADGDAPTALEPWVKSQGFTRDVIQAILAELIAPNFDYRTVPGIATKLRLPQKFIREALTRLSSENVPNSVRGLGRIRITATRSTGGVRAGSKEGVWCAGSIAGGMHQWSTSQ